MSFFGALKLFKFYSILRKNKQLSGSFIKQDFTQEKWRMQSNYAFAK